MSESALRVAIERVFDGIEVVVRWAAAWVFTMFIFGTPLMIVGLHLDESRSPKASRVFIFLTLGIYLVGVPLALIDLALRARGKATIFSQVETAWAEASSPALNFLQRALSFASALLHNLLRIGAWAALGLVVVVAVGIALYFFFGALSTTPWWAIVIIVLLITQRR